MISYTSHLNIRSAETYLQYDKPAPTTEHLLADSERNRTKQDPSDNCLW